jgi:hypothetical protein
MLSFQKYALVTAATAIAIGLVVACGSGDASTFNGGGDVSDGGDESQGMQFGNGNGDAMAGGNTQCKKLTCADQHIECGPAGDGCGGLIKDCGDCATGTRCGGPGAPSKCVSPNKGTMCTPKTCADLGVECGPAGDGCGGEIQCGTCMVGQQCGAVGHPSQCVQAVATGPDGGACIKLTCADYLKQNKDCGTQSDGCGGTLDCGKCVDPEFCGGGGPSKCAVSGGGKCTPKTCADFPNTCGPQSDTCGGVTSDCGGCIFPQVCGGGGVPSVCGGGSTKGPDGGACTPITTCGPTQCGQIADGCGGVLDCGTGNCTGGNICGGAGTPNVCGAPKCTPLTKCGAGLNCGSIADGCGGSVVCGGGVPCPGASICGGGGIANQCGGGVVTGPGGGPCVPIITCPPNSCGPIADGCGNSINCGTCLTGACGGAGVPSQCGGGNVCIPFTQAVACGTKTCGYAPDGCGNVYTCGALNGACPAGEACGLFAPDQCGSLTGPCIQNGSATKCVSNSQCCSGNCGALGTCIAAACKNIGVACGTGNDCCSGTCTGGLCASNGSLCLASGSSCNVDMDCCSKGCIGGKCSTATSYCLQDGDACTDEHQCCGGACNGATATKAGTCGLVAAPGGGISCTIAGTVVLCSSSTTYTCNTACCSGSCGPNGSAPGHEICQKPEGCSVQGELCYSSNDCCGYPTPKSLSCSKPAGAKATDPGRCNGEQSCSKSGQVCKTVIDACSFPNNCCEPADIALAGGGNCSSNPDACCRHDNLGVPRCTEFGVCRQPGQTCQTSADCCPIAGVPPPCAPDNTGTFVCGGTSCEPDGNKCTVNADCCNGNCFFGTPGSTTGVCKIPTCTPKTCADYPGKCGTLDDGCGGKTGDCGDCTFPQTCGGAGTPNVCGGTVCTPNTCAGLGAQCGTIPDGCGVLLTCPLCTTGVCGGGGVANQCGTPTCKALTCADQGIQCGQTGDGCGNVLTCPTCPPGQTCGGGGKANQCGAPACTPATTCPVGKNCGDWPDGCGGSIHCGDCTKPNDTCGGGGAPNVCGQATCTAKNCAQQGAQCGTISDQCGGVVTCPTCGANQFCNGQNLCVGLTCIAKTCAQLGVQCGPTADGCGGLDQCGPCPVGQGCGAGGVPGQCGKLACTPLTCTQVGAKCGQVADGCGGLTPDCGTCAGTLACKNGACVQACTPITCASVGANCGYIADGCGGQINCGTCSNGETCGYNNIANVCGKGATK